MLVRLESNPGVTQLAEFAKFIDDNSVRAIVFNIFPCRYCFLREFYITVLLGRAAVMLLAFHAGAWLRLPGLTISRSPWSLRIHVGGDT